jgi:hypothetical protein
VTGPIADHQLDDLMRDEVVGWTPRGVPDMHDVLRRADRGWQRELATYSGLVTAALAIILVAAVVILLLGSHLGVADGIRERLLAH